MENIINSETSCTYSTTYSWYLNVNHVVICTIITALKTILWHFRHLFIKSHPIRDNRVSKYCGRIAGARKSSVEIKLDVFKEERGAMVRWHATERSHHRIGATLGFPDGSTPNLRRCFTFTVSPYGERYLPAVLFAISGAIRQARLRRHRRRPSTRAMHLSQTVCAELCP